ncbi:ABC transporter permease [bacterium]|nr:ABC transporter permease [bacterium]
MANLLAFIGRKFISFIEHVGGVFVLLGRVLKSLPWLFGNLGLVVEQMSQMGVNSLPLVLITSIFTGAVSAIQAAYQFQDFVPMRYLGTAVGKAVVIELGPVLTALVVAGRVGASIAAELGTMKVTEQLDALKTLAIDPVPFLVSPRFIAGLAMLPILTIMSDFIAIMGGYTVALLFLDITSNTFLSGLKMFFHFRDVIAGLVKALVFGGIISTIGCYQGFQTKGGAKGVGRSTTKAVVISMVLILIGDYVIASLVF